MYESFLGGLLGICIAGISWMIVACILIYLLSLFIHIFILIFKGSGGFKGTFTVLTYGVVSTIFWIIPYDIDNSVFIVLLLIRFLLSTVLGALIGIIGFKYVHRLNIIRAAASYLIPQLLLWGGFIILFLFVN